MASIKPKGTGKDRVWRAEVKKRGVRKHRTFKAKTAAERWAAELELAIERGEYDPGKAPPGSTVKDAIERYRLEVSTKKKGHQKEGLRLDYFAGTRLAGVELAYLDRTDIVSWRDARLLEVSPATVDREMTLLSHILNTATREWQWLSESPTKFVSRPKPTPPRQQRVSDQDVDAIYCAAGYEFPMEPALIAHRVALAFEFAIETALRSGEICSARWTDLGERGLTLHIPRTKTDAPRTVPLSRRAEKIIRVLEPVTAESGKIFDLESPSRDANFRKLRKRAGIGDIRFHDARREALTRLSKKLDVMQLARVSGHKDIRILQNVYYAPDPEDLAQVIRGEEE